MNRDTNGTSIEVGDRVSVRVMPPGPGTLEYGFRTYTGVVTNNEYEVYVEMDPAFHADVEYHTPDYDPSWGNPNLFVSGNPGWELTVWNSVPHQQGQLSLEEYMHLEGFTD